MSINPTYWGSLASIILAGLITFLSISDAPDHAAADLGPDNPDLRFFLFLAMLTFFALRGYLEVIQGSYGGNPKHILRLPDYNLRITAYFINVGIIVVANLCVAIAVGFSIKLAFILCLFMQLLSFSLSITWIMAKKFRKSEFGDVVVNGVGFNLIAAMVVYFSISNFQSGSTGPVIFFTAATFFVFIFEVKERFYSQLRDSVLVVAATLADPGGPR